MIGGLRWAWLAAGVLLMPTAAAAQDCLADGLALSNEGDLSGAVLAFNAARARAECKDDPFLLLNMALASQKLAEKRRSGRAACRSAEAYQAFLEVWTEEDLRPDAEAGLVEMKRMCAAARAKVKPPSDVIAETDTPPKVERSPFAVKQTADGDYSTSVWVLGITSVIVVAAGATGLFLSQSAYNEAESTYADYAASRNPAEAEGLWNDIKDQHGRGDLFRWVGYGLVGLGAALGVTAVGFGLASDGGGATISPLGDGAVLGWSTSW